LLLSEAFCDEEKLKVTKAVKMTDATKMAAKATKTYFFNVNTFFISEYRLTVN
jgi:hypothetical protein